MRYLNISVLFLLFLSCGEKQEKVLPQKSQLISSVYASATIQPDSIYQVYAVVIQMIKSKRADIALKLEKNLEKNNWVAAKYVF